MKPSSMIPMRFLNFVPRHEFRGTLDQDVLNLIICLQNGYGLQDQDIWIRDLGDKLEIAVVASFTRDIRSVATLIKVDNILGGFRSRKFNLGEIRPAVATFILITLEIGDPK